MPYKSVYHKVYKAKIDSQSDYPQDVFEFSHKEEEGECEDVGMSEGKCMWIGIG